MANKAVEALINHSDPYRPSNLDPEELNQLRMSLNLWCAPIGYATIRAQRREHSIVFNMLEHGSCWEFEFFITGALVSLGEANEVLKERLPKIVWSIQFAERSYQLYRSPAGKISVACPLGLFPMARLVRGVVKADVPGAERLR